ncbi:MAG: tetratricopeptide repeat protein [Ignavibacteriaceae bacterium]
MVKKADSLFYSGSYVESAKIYEKIVELNPEDIESIYNLSISYHTTGNYERAIKYHKMVADYMESDHTDGLVHYKRNGLYNLACAYSLMGDIDNSINTLNLAIEAGFDNTGTMTRDSDLENVRKDVRFQDVLKNLRIKEFQSKGSNISNPSPEQISEGVEIVLQTIKEQHPNPYRHFTEAEWDEKADSIIAQADELSEIAYLVELIGLVGMAGDVHTSAFPLGQTLLQDSYSLRFWKFSDGLYVRAASEKLKHLVGAKVIAINDVPFDDAWELLMNKFPTENEWMSTYMIQLYIQFPSLLHALGLSESDTGGSWTFVMPDNKQITMYLEAEEKVGYSNAMSTSFVIKAPKGWIQGHDDLVVAPFWLRNVEENYWYEIIKDKSAVFFQMNIPRYNRQKPWDKFLDEMFITINESEEIDRLIIDLRHHEGGWDYMAKALVRKILQSPKIDRPGGLYIITHRVTQSAGLAFIGWMEMATYPIIVGEPAGAHPLLKNGAWGNHKPIELPGTTITFRVSTHNENMTDAIDDRHIVAPDIPTSMTYDDYKSGKDPALEAALNFPLDKGHLFFEDAGGRLIPRYLPWRRLSQKNAFEKKKEVK